MRGRGRRRGEEGEKRERIVKNRDEDKISDKNEKVRDKESRTSLNCKIIT
jgi:hypothetical protein